MQRENRVLRVLRDKSGSSFVFVLGIMMLLMTIGVSVLAAASANTGFALKQKEHSQIIVLDESVHKNIMYSLQHNASNPSPLSAQLVMAIYEANDPDLTSYSTTGLEDMLLTISIDNEDYLESGAIKVESITLSFPEQNVIITPPQPAIYILIYDDEGEIIRTRDKDREPKTALIKATMIVTVVINANDKLVTTRAIYEFQGGSLSDDPDGTAHVGDDRPGVMFDMAFTSDGYGSWRLIKHENVDSKD